MSPLLLRFYIHTSGVSSSPLFYYRCLAIYASSPIQKFSRRADGRCRCLTISLFSFSILCVGGWFCGSGEGSMAKLVYAQSRLYSPLFFSSFLNWDRSWVRFLLLFGLSVFNVLGAAPFFNAGARIRGEWSGWEGRLYC